MGWNKCSLLSLAIGFMALTANAQSDSTQPTNKNTIKIGKFANAPIRKAYFGNALDGMIFSTALIDNNGTKSLGTLRFSAFFHFGLTYNYNFNKNVGVYTGLDLKNIGFIEKFQTLKSTAKYRVYTLGVPVGLRFGDMGKRSYFFLGGGLDIALQYKKKYWDNNHSKTKSNDWFSDETQIFMPYIFAGIAHKGTTIKIQYYPTNFFNENYIDNQYFIPYKPYANKNVNLLLVSVGRDMKFGKKK